MKTQAQQIDKLISGFIKTSPITITGLSLDITSYLLSALTTGGINSTPVNNINSNNELTPGIIVDSNNISNIVIIDTYPDTDKIVIGYKSVIGLLSYNTGVYTISFSYLDVNGNYAAINLTENYIVTLKIPYRFELKDFPTDSIIKLKQLWLEKGNKILSTWENDVNSIRQLTNYNNGSDIGCYSNQSVYEYDKSSIETDDGETILKPANIEAVVPGRWIQKLTMGEILYSNLNPSTVTGLQGIPLGTTFNNLTMKQMWDMLLYPYQLPIFNSFFFAPSITPLEVGVSIPTGSKTFNWSTSNSFNISSNTISISGPGIITTSGLNNSGNTVINMSAITQAAPSSQTWLITGTNSKGQQFTKTYSVTWKLSLYYGESSLANLAASDILSLRNILGDTQVNTLSFIYAEQKYKYFCYPATYPDISLVKRQDNGTSVPGLMLDPIAVTKNGVTNNYKVWRSYEKLEGAQTLIFS